MASKSSARVVGGFLFFININQFFLNPFRIFVTINLKIKNYV